MRLAIQHFLREFYRFCVEIRGKNMAHGREKNTDDGSTDEGGFTVHDFQYTLQQKERQ